MDSRDRTTTVDELKSQVRGFVTERDWDQFHFPKDLAIGLAIEAAELLEHFRFRSDEEIAALLGDDAYRREVGHELADVLYFVLLMCTNLRFDASSLLAEKLALSAQRYPIEMARGRNVKYTEFDRPAVDEREA